MRLGWRLPLGGIGPVRFNLGGTVWRSKPRQRPRPQRFHGTLPATASSHAWQCQHNHTRQDTALECARAEGRRRLRQVGNH